MLVELGPRGAPARSGQAGACRRSGERAGARRHGLHPGCATAAGSFGASPGVNKRRAFLLLPGRGRGGGGDSGEAGHWKGAAVAGRAMASHWSYPARRGPSPPSASLTWEDGEASGHDAVLGHPSAGELEACGHFGKRRRGAGVLRQPGFLKHPSCCRRGCGASVEVESTGSFLRGWRSQLSLLKPNFLPKHPRGGGKTITRPSSAGFRGIPPPPGLQDVWLKDRACKAQNSGGAPRRGRCGGPQHQLMPALCLQ